MHRFREEVTRLYQVLDRQLAANEYLAGEYSIADIASWPWVARWEWQGQNLEDYPSVKRWFRAIEARPAVQRALKVGADWADFNRQMSDEDKKRLFNLRDEDFAAQVVLTASVERLTGGSVTGFDGVIAAAVPYAAPMTVRPRFHANDASRDVLAIERLVDGGCERPQRQPAARTRARRVSALPPPERDRRFPRSGGRSRSATAARSATCCSR